MTPFNRTWRKSMVPLQIVDRVRMDCFKAGTSHRVNCRDDSNDFWLRFRHPALDLLLGSRLWGLRFAAARLFKRVSSVVEVVTMGEKELWPLFSELVVRGRVFVRV